MVVYVFILTEEPDLSQFDLVERSQLKIETGSDNRLLLRVSGNVTPELEKKIVASVQHEDRNRVSETMAQYHTRPTRPLSPAERGEPILVPQLTLLQEGAPELAEYVLDDHIWNILDYPAELTETDFKIEEKASTYEFDIKGEKLTYKFLGKQLPLDFSDTESGLTDLQHTRWLEPLPSMVNSVNSDFLKGIVRLEDRLILLLEVEKVLDLGEQKCLEARPVPAT